MRRTYWLARSSPEAAPLLVVLHGLGMDGHDMAAFTGLAERGPRAGFATVFPDATEPSRELAPAPKSAAALLCFAGTADPLVPYAGGSIGASGLIGRLADRRRGEPRRLGVPIEMVARDWAAVNGAAREPIVERLACAPGELAVTRLSWRAPGSPPVEVYRIDGGGHGWPGGSQYLPRRLVGPIAGGPDATAILLAAARRHSECG